MLVIKIEGEENETATHLIAKTCFLSGFYVQSFSLPRAGYVKFDKNPVVSRQEEFSDFLIVIEDPTPEHCLKFAREKSVVIINAKEKPKLPAAKKRRLKVCSIDASGIPARERSKVLAAALLGALIKNCNKITTKAARHAIGDDREMFLALDEGFRNVK
jgi:Pyruvate/2-oxoacid:ferredoxin oxidoreductase gamma subunit